MSNITIQNGANDPGFCVSQIYIFDSWKIEEDHLVGWVSCWNGMKEMITKNIIARDSDGRCSWFLDSDYNLYVCSESMKKEQDLFPRSFPCQDIIGGYFDFDEGCLMI